MANSVTIGALKDLVVPVMSASEQALADKLESISSGDAVSNIDLLSYQMELSANSLTASVSSSVAKERCDCLKGVVQKF